MSNKINFRPLLPALAILAVLGGVPLANAAPINPLVAAGAPAVDPSDVYALIGFAGAIGPSDERAFDAIAGQIIAFPERYDAATAAYARSLKLAQTLAPQTSDDAN